MLTLQELKQIVDVPYPGMKIPTAKKLKEYGTVIAKKSMGCETEILAFQNGYALYQVSRFTTVFPICFCGEYQYNAEQADCISEEFFNQREWYIRLVLEGEDRLSRNQESKEQGWTISYSDVSEEWGMLQTEEKSPLEMLVGRESVNEIFEVLTELQKRVFYGCFFHQKTQNELSKELGISPSAVSRTLSRAMNRMRRYYADVRSGGCKRKEIREWEERRYAWKEAERTKKLYFADRKRNTCGSNQGGLSGMVSVPEKGKIPAGTETEIRCLQS